MAKTNWIDGTHLTPAQMILFFGNNAGSGHDHDGTDDDGHCPKITVETMADDYIEGTFGIDVSSTYFTTPVSNATAYYLKIGNLVTIIFPDIQGTHASNAAFQMSPNGGNWPAAIIPSTAQLVGGVYMNKQDPSLAELRLGSLQIPNSTSSNIIAALCDDTAELLQAGFGTGGGQPKGILRQSITYYVD